MMYQGYMKNGQPIFESLPNAEDGKIVYMFFAEELKAPSVPPGNAEAWLSFLDDLEKNGPFPGAFDNMEKLDLGRELDF